MFEQSGTFKNEAKKLGLEAVDLDILDDFGETDYKIDLFDEIKKGYEGKPSIFDKVKKEDYILAFFPCTRFENQFQLFLRGEASQEKNYTDIEKIEKSRKIFNEVNDMYQLISKLFITCLRGGKKLIVENPYSTQHMLVKFFPIKSKIIHNDRTLYGDYFKKPTQYWFVNCEPKHNFFLENLQTSDEFIKTIKNTHSQVERSLISKTYANRFIREFIL